MKVWSLRIIFFLNGWEEVKLILNYWVFVSIKLYLKKWFQIKIFINLEIIGEKDKNIKKKLYLFFKKSIKISSIWWSHVAQLRRLSPTFIIYNMIWYDIPKFKWCYCININVQNSMILFLFLVVLLYKSINRHKKYHQLMYRLLLRLNP